MKTNKNHQTKQFGFTLIEVMVSLLIGTIIIGGILSVFINTKSTQRYVSALAQLQESGYFSLSFLKRDIRMIDYKGCINYDDNDVNIMAIDLAALAIPANEFKGFKVTTNNSWMAGEPFAATISAKPNTDAFHIGRMTDHANTLTEDTVASSTLIKINNSPSLDIENDSAMLISNCLSADAFTVDSTTNGTMSLTVTHSGGGNFSDSLSAIYQVADTTISSYQNTIYFISDTGRDAADGTAINALFQAVSPNYQPQELIAGAEDMKLLYVESMPLNKTRIVQATGNTTAINWDNVIAVKVALLMASPELVLKYDDENSYTLLDRLVIPAGASPQENEHIGGRRLKKVYSTTITIRNRAL